MVIVGVVTIDNGSGENVGEPRKLDGIELVLSLLVSASSLHKMLRKWDIPARVPAGPT
jgi:hypothetical protein